MGFNGVWHASFTVKNLEASLEFYCGLLGLELYHQQVQHNEYTAKLVGYPDAHLKVAMLRIPRIAHIEAPLPRCATMTRPWATSAPAISGRQAATYS